MKIVIIEVDIARSLILSPKSGIGSGTTPASTRWDGRAGCLPGFQDTGHLNSLDLLLTMPACKTEIIGLGRHELADQLTACGLDPQLVKPIWNGIYVRGLTDFSQFDPISKKHQAQLSQTFTIGRPTIATNLTSIDGTRKWLLQFGDGHRVETVLIPETDRGALCVSSQVGCTLSCTFCHTGTMKLARNLTPSEIVGQVMNARDQMSEWGRQRTECVCTNIVLMGMGEPLFNYDNVARGLRIIMDGDGIGISRRRIMLSTAGVVPMIRRVGEELGVNLAISLHAVRDQKQQGLCILILTNQFAELFGRFDFLSIDLQDEHSRFQPRVAGR